MNNKLSRKTLTLLYVVLFVVTLLLSCFIIVFSAINANFGNQAEIYYTAADINNGRSLNQAIKASTSYTSENTNIKRVVFDYYTTKEIVSDGDQEIYNVSYIENGENVLAGATGSSLLWDLVTVELYRISNDDGTYTVYILSDEDIIASQNMSNSFYNLTAVQEIVLNNFKVTNETNNLSSMFYHCFALNEIDVSNFDTSNVTTMQEMFHGCLALKNLYLSNFVTSSVTTMRYMFGNCASLTELDLLSFNLEGFSTTGNVTDMSYMFWDCSSLESLIVPFDTSKVTTMESMFGNCASLVSLDVSTFDTENVTNMGGRHTVYKISEGGSLVNSYCNYGMFGGCASLTTLNLDNFNTSNVTSMKFMFADCNALETIDLSGLDTSKVTDIEGIFSGCSSITNDSIATIKNWNTGNITIMGCESGTWIATGVFNDCDNLTTIDLSGWDTRKATDMSGMFIECSNLNNIILGENWDTSNVTTMTGMFANCSSLSENGVDLSRFNTKNVTTFGIYNSTTSKARGIFQGCSSLVNVDLSGWSSESLTSVQNMFRDCSKLKSVVFGENFTCEYVTDFRAFFSGCSSIETIDLSRINTSSAIYMGGTLWSAHMGVFSGCSSLTTIIYGEGWDTSNVTTFERMFYNCGTDVVTIVSD